MILVCVAMHDEIKYIKLHRSFSSKLILTSIGKVNAAMHLSESLARNHVKKIINLGFAGATKDYQVGDLVLIDHAMYHDFDLSLFGYQKGQVPGYPPVFHSDDTLTQMVLDKFPSIKRGDLFTGDFFMSKDLDRPMIFDMEGAALYQVAHRDHTPIVSIKVISDIVGTGDATNYHKFDVDHGAKVLEEVYRKLIMEEEE